jgi:RHS repeat-associated protein
MHSPEARVALDGSLLFRGLSHGVNRLTQISSVGGASSASPISFNYTYNQANQRTQNVLADGSYWIYGYDSLGQVTSGVKYFADGTLVPGQQFGYTFDTIGNRTQTQSGGDQTGANLRTANYYANNLNQLTNRDVPGYVDVKGVSIGTNVVTVNGQTAYRKGEYFRQELTNYNGSSALWTNIIVTATGQTSVTGNVYVAQQPEQFSYDPDGNLTNDGRFAYTWDGENRLVAMTNNTGVGPKYGLTFAYDPQCRRIQKFVATNGVPVYTNRFLYDGWNLVAILDPQSTILESFMWGSDLSGSMQGAGGVGGLLTVTYKGTATTNCFPAFDGNGNVAALVNAADGTVVANYEYGPFGEVLRATGPMAKANPFRFSTKYQDDESDLLYYGYRSYNPSTGVWPNRDSLQELGGLNLYNAFQNNPVNNVDFDGRFTLTEALALVAIVTVASVIIVQVGVHANSVKHIPIQEYIVGEYMSDGKCKGALDLEAYGTIKQEPPLPNDGGLGLKVVIGRAYWKSTGKHTMHVWVYGFVTVQGSKNSMNSGEIVDQWDFTSDNLCCP